LCTGRKRQRPGSSQLPWDARLIAAVWLRTGVTAAGGGCALIECAGRNSR
jgi:hypothetical protein